MLRHKLSHDEAKKVSAEKRNIKRGTVQQYQKMPCPVESCKKLVCRVDKHLLRTHLFTKDSDAFQTYNRMAKAHRAGIKNEQQQLSHQQQDTAETSSSDGQQQPILSSKDIKGKRKAAVQPRRRLPVISSESGDSDEGNDATYGETSKPLTYRQSSDEEEDELVPREADPGFLIQAMEDNPILKSFYSSLVSIDGGARPSRSSKDNAVRVTRLLFQVDPEVTRVKRLWRSKYVKKIRQAFFEGNQNLQKPRKPGTLNAIIAAYRLFLNYMLSCSDDAEFNLHEQDIIAINATIKRTAHWGKAFRTVALSREAQVRDRDFDNILTSVQYLELTGGEQARALVSQLKSIKPGQLDLFVHARDYLMLRLILSCAQRPGAVANLTVREYQAAETDVGTGYSITFTAKHKTSSMGPAPLAWDEELREIGEIYFNLLRPHFCNSKSFFEGVPGCSQRGEPFFLSSAGRPLNSSQVSRRIDQMGKMFCPSMKGNLSGARIRKSAVSHHRLSGVDAPKDTAFAKTMSHAVGTANRHYNLEDSVKNNANIAQYLNIMMTEDATNQPEQPSTSKTQPPTPPPQPIGKVAAWLAETEEPPQSLPGTSGSIRKFWSHKEEQILLHATRMLPRRENTPRKSIVDAVEADNQARKIMIDNGGQFSDQQIRDKFKSMIRKSKKK